MQRRILFWLVLLALEIVAISFSPKLLSLSSTLFEVAGIFLIFYGILLSSIAGRTLKLYAHRRKETKLSVPDKFTAKGIYNCMRHPGQFGLLFVLAGLAVASGKILVILFTGWLLLFGLGFILFIEERETLQKFGQRYCDYMKTTPPFTFGCIKRGLQAIGFERVKEV